MDQRSDNDAQDKNGQHVSAQRIVEEVVPHQAIRKKGEHIVEAEERPATEGG